MTQKSLPKIRIPSAKSEDQPATRKMLSLVRDELKSEIGTVGRKVDRLELRFDHLEARFDGLEARFDGLENRFDGLEARLDVKFQLIDFRFNKIEKQMGDLTSAFDGMKTEQIRANILFEEQNANNRIVLEGLQALWQRQERIETGLNRKI
jgi:hypothetical protein